MKDRKDYAMFISGALSAALVMGTVGTALAASGKVEFNFSNVALNGEQKITAGETITAPNGQQVPGTILYVDAAGGKTNYLPIRAVSDLLGTEIGYDPATKTILLGKQTTVQTLPQTPQRGPLMEKDLMIQDGYWGWFSDGTTHYVNMNIQYTGDAIERLTLRTESGSIATQSVPEGFKPGSPGVKQTLAGPQHRLITYGETFEDHGSELTLTGAELAQKPLIFWKAEALDKSLLPVNHHFTAEILLKNGERQTLKLMRETTGRGVGEGRNAVEDRDGNPIGYALSAYYHSLPLSQCQLVQSQPIKDTFTYTVDDYTGKVVMPEKSAFDQNGDYRDVRKNISGRIYLPTLHKNADGSVEGRLYLVPQAMEYHQ